MATELKIEVDFDGIQAAVSGLNATAAADERMVQKNKKIAGLKLQLFQLAKRQREEAFKQLAPEQQLERLMARRERLQRMLTRAKGDELRTSHLLLATRRNEASLQNIQRTNSVGGRARSIVSEIPGGAAVMRFFDLVGARAVVAGLGVRAFYNEVRASQVLTDLSSKMDVSVTRLQALQSAARKTRTDLSLLNTAIVSLRKNQGIALSGGEPLLIKAFQELGISQRELASLSPDELLLRISRQFENGGASAAKFAALLKVAEESAKDLLPAMERGLAQMVTEFEGANQQIRTSTVTALAGIGNFWDEQLGSWTDNIKRFTAETFGELDRWSKLGLGAATALMAPFSDQAKAMSEELFTDFFASGGFERTFAGALNRTKPGRLLTKAFGLDADAGRDEEEAAANLARRRKQQEQADQARGEAATRQDQEAAARADARMAEEDKALAQRAALEKEIADIKFQSLSPEEQALKLAERRKEIEEEIAILTALQNATGVDNQTAILAATAELFKLDAAEKSKGDKKAGSGFQTTADSLTRIGGFQGGETAAVKVAERANVLLAQIVVRTAEISMESARTARAMGAN